MPGTYQVPHHYIADYAAARASLDLHLNGLDGKQVGDPEKLALLIIQAAGAAQPPVHLFAGQRANELAEEKLKAVSGDLAAWKGASQATDFTD
ncbi:hypothetical protein ACL2XO_21310 [Sodalis sp. RH15]|uniref:hypothetical protein n=1 Tax=Sodalis sp. RH15 TaxID=3394330 RepID=UPI0039B3FAA6